MNINGQEVKTSFAIPAARITEFEDKQIRDALARELVNRLLKAGVISKESEAVVRDARPNTDLGFTNQNYLSAAMVATTWLAYVNNQQLATTKALGIFAFSFDDAAPSTAQIRIAPGTNAGDRYVVQTEVTNCELVTKVYLSEPAVFDPQEFMHVQLYPRTTKAGGERVIIHALVAERPGPNISNL